MIRYALSITTLDREGEVVTRVRWLLTGIDDANGAKQAAKGSTRIPFDADAEFTAFDDLTKRQVRSWLEGSREVEATKTAIARSLAEADFPAPENVPPPWAPADPEKKD